MIDVSILGASGYTGGELLRLLLQHPDVRVISATSDRHAGSWVHRVHPNLRGAARLRFVTRDAMQPADVVFTCVPHGQAAAQVAELLAAGQRVVDLSADFRLRSSDAHARWYGGEHPAPELLQEAIYGLPELHRGEMKGARLISGVGCLATAMNLALWPLARSGVLAGATIVADVKVGSSAAGAELSAGSMHAERSRSIRLYAPTSHRHVAEVLQECGVGEPPPTLHVSAHAVELVRGVLATCHVLLAEGAPALATRELWRLWREAYDDEGFVRVVKERAGLHRWPDPKLVAGSNFADVGFDVEDGGNRIVTACALDNLVKGAAGSAVQSMNLMLGLDEARGLGQLPLHPA